MKLLKMDAVPYFERLVKLCLGESILTDSTVDWQKVNGISISPKKSFCIVKLWLGDALLNKPEQFDLGAYSGEVVYRSNRENISTNHLK